MNNLLISDAYKQSHREQYPDGTTLVYSNWTPRSDKHATVKGGVVVFGIQAFLQKISNDFDRNFFGLPREEVIESFKQGYYEFFGVDGDSTHVAALHDLGYLPIKVKALPEGSICPIGVPMLTIYNTHPSFFWLTNFLETIMSTELWLPMTSATIAKGYYDDLKRWSTLTCDNDLHLPFQAHDFSMRGMSGLEAAMASGAGHLLSFNGTDTIPAVHYLKRFYHADPTNELVGTSIPATEHSVMSMGTKDDELGTFRRLITETYPNGFISIVSDTWDLWKVCEIYLPKLKEEILARNGKVIIRPDSGDPVDIICGILTPGKPNCYNNYAEMVKADDYHHMTESQAKGVIELLWDTFGGTINNKGYKVLDPHIGAIYGDSITIDRANAICERLADKGFASSNIVFGIGSYTYQFNTRDVYGFAMKATYGELLMINENFPEGDGIFPREIFKDPVTDDGAKKSLKGLLCVDLVDNKYIVTDQCNWAEENHGELKVVYHNGIFENIQTLSEIRKRLR